MNLSQILNFENKDMNDINISCFLFKLLANQAYLRRQQGKNEKTASREGSDQKKQREN